MGKEFQKSFGQVAKTSPKSCGQVAKAPLEGHVTSKQSFLKRPVHTEGALPRKTVGIKRPDQPLVPDESKRVRKVESEPGPLEVTEQPCKDQPRVLETVKPKATKRTERQKRPTDRKDLKPAPHELSEKPKDKGSQQANAKGFLEPRPLGAGQECDALIPSGHRPGDLHKEKVPLPPGEKKLFSPARKLDWKRKAMKSPEEPPGKKKVRGGGFGQ